MCLREVASYTVITKSSLIRNSQHGLQMYVDFAVALPLKLFKGPRCCRKYMKNKKLTAFQCKITYMYNSLVPRPLLD